MDFLKLVASGLAVAVIMTIVALSGLTQIQLLVLGGVLTCIWLGWKVLGESGQSGERGGGAFFWLGGSALLGGVGVFLAIGNTSGTFPTFPFAGAMAMFASAILYLIGTSQRDGLAKSGSRATSRADVRALVKLLANALTVKQDIHAETLLSAIGALAGYACQISIRAEFIQLKGAPEAAVFIVIQGADGKKYYSGDLLNKLLVESQYSVWSLGAGTARHLGARNLPDIHDIFRHVSQTIGGETFGIPRIPPGHRPTKTPVEYVKILWPRIFPVVKQHCPNPLEWPILLALVAQEIQLMSKAVIEPGLAFSIVMESAVPMSKVHLESL